jgi:hypothetical protein
VTAATVVALLVSVAVAAYLAGMARGQAIEKKRTAARDAADVDEAVEVFGPVHALNGMDVDPRWDEHSAQLHFLHAPEDEVEGEVEAL